MSEYTVLFGTLAGILASLAAQLLPGGKRRPLVTAVAAAAASLILASLYPYRGAPGVIGLTAYLVALAAILTAPSYMPPGENLAFHDSLVLALAAASYLVSTADSLLRLFALWEAMSVAVAVLTAYEKRRESVEAALKYVMLCGTGSLLALLGIILVHAETGSFSTQALGSASITSKALIVVGFGAEAALFPLHLWLPDAYMAAPSTGNAVLSGITAEAAAYVVYKVSAGSPRLLSAVLAAALLGAFTGNLAAYRQDDLKRLLAYSSVSNVNYILLGLAAGGAASSYALLHILAHGLLKAALFLLSGTLLLSFGTRSLEELRGALSGTWLGKFTAVAAALGLTGVPPFLTFWSEAFMTAGVYMYSSAAADLLAAAILTSFGYYFRLFYRLCRPAPNGARRAPTRGTALLYAAAALTLLDMALGIAWAAGLAVLP